MNRRARRLVGRGIRRRRRLEHHLDAWLVACGIRLFPWQRAYLLTLLLDPKRTR